MKDDDVMSAEEFFEEEIDLEPKNPLPVARKRLKKAKKDIFAGIKVKMVMRIYGVSRARALEIIAGRAAEKKALEDAKEKKGKKERNNAGKFLSAEEFFGEIGEPKKAPRKCRSRGKKPETLFAAVKVKMVMRIYGVSRAKALEIIAKRESEAKAAEKENENGEI